MSSHPLLSLPNISVVKLGGSVIFSDALSDWLAAILSSERPFIIVPGGGPFADQVRRAQYDATTRGSQKRLFFSDKAAHKMALLAMDQMAHLLADRMGEIERVTNPGSICASLEQGKTAVWAPSRMVLNDRKIAENWEVTSDSLAAWLAGKLSLSRLYLIKSRHPEKTSYEAGKLARDGIVDLSFPLFLAAAKVEAYLLGPGDEAVLSGACDGLRMRRIG